MDSTPSSNNDAATKKYVDDNSGGEKTSLITLYSNIDLKNTYRVLNLRLPNDLDEPATKLYTDNNFFKKDGSHPMIGDINMNNKYLYNIVV